MRRQSLTLCSLPVRRLAAVVVAMLLATILLVSTARASNDEGIAFLEENAKKPGVVTLPSGLQYKVLEEGKGVYHPLPNTPCSCHYAGTLIDGTTFDSSYDRGEPTTFAPNQVIKGWTEAMQLMVEGDVYELYIPSELAYGEQGSPPKIPGGSVLIFKMQIVEILADAESEGLPLAIKCKAATGELCNDKEKAYIEKTAAWSDEKKKTELERLGKLVGEKKSMKPDLVHWIQRRTKILEQLVPASSSAGEQDEEL